MENLNCRKCGACKSVSEFYFRKDNNKYRNECKSCVSERGKEYGLRTVEQRKIRTKQYRETNKESLYKVQKQWREANKERVKVRMSGYQALNKEVIKEKRKLFYEQNKERISAEKMERYKNPEVKSAHRARQHKYDLENKERLRSARRIWERDRLENDPVYRLSKNVRRRVVMALKTKTNGIRTQELIGCSIPELADHLEKQFQAGMSWENYGEWHIDHRIPLSWFNLENENCLKLALNYKNLQPLWAAENHLKNNKKADVLPY